MLRLHVSFVAPRAYSHVSEFRISSSTFLLRLLQHHASAVATTLHSDTMADQNRSFTQAQRTFFASLMRFEDHTLGMDPRLFTDGVMAGQFDALIAADSSILTELPPSDRRLTDASKLQDLNSLSDTESFIERKKKTEKERRQYAKAMRGQSKPAWDAAYHSHDKARQLQFMEAARQQIPNRPPPRDKKTTYFVANPDPYPPCTKSLEDLEQVRKDNFQR